MPSNAALDRALSVARSRRGRGRFGWALIVLAAAVATVSIVGVGAAAGAKPPGGPAQPDFGPNVVVFDPSMSTSQIQAAVDSIASQQVSNQFGSQRYALLFKPGTYGTATDPLNFQVGYYTAVAGLGSSPNDVVVNGSIYVHNQCAAGSCVALNNFWRSLSNLTINVNTPELRLLQRRVLGGVAGRADASRPRQWVRDSDGLLHGPVVCERRLHRRFEVRRQHRGQRLAAAVAGQEQHARRLDERRLEPGVLGRGGCAGPCFPAQASCGGPYTTLATSPVTRDAPYLYVDPDGHYNVFVPSVQHDSVGASWDGAPTAGSSIPIDDFFIAKPTDGAQAINNALARGQNLIFTPGVYQVDKTIKVRSGPTPSCSASASTLVPSDGVVPMTVADVPGVKLAGLLFDAGQVNSPVLLQVGTPHAHKSDPADPTSLQDVFFRIGGATPGKAPPAWS